MPAQVLAIPIGLLVTAGTVKLPVTLVIARRFDLTAYPDQLRLWMVPL
jgi:hypothetical protein